MVASKNYERFGFTSFTIANIAHIPNTLTLWIRPNVSTHFWPIEFPSPIDRLPRFLWVKSCPWAHKICHVSLISSISAPRIFTHTPYTLFPRQQCSGHSHLVFPENWRVLYLQYPKSLLPRCPNQGKKKLPWRTDLLTTRKSTEGIEVSCIGRPRTIWPSGLVIFWILPPKKEDLYPSLETCVKSGLKLEFVKKFWTACLGFLENSSISTCYNKLFSSGNLTQQWNEWSSEWILGFSRANETYERMFLPSLKLRIRWSRQSEQWTEAFASLKYHRSNNADEGAEK